MIQAPQWHPAVRLACADTVVSMPGPGFDASGWLPKD